MYPLNRLFGACSFLPGIVGIESIAIKQDAGNLVKSRSSVLQIQTPYKYEK
jgi:hypothetical protein